MDIRLVVSDLDGTALLARAGSRVSKEVVAAARIAGEAGILLSVATGRPVCKTLEVLDQLEVEVPVVVNGGTKLYDPVTHRVLWGVPIPDHSLDYLADVASSFHFEVLMDEEEHGDGDVLAQRLASWRGEPIHAMYLVGVPVGEAPAVMQILAKVPGVACAVSSHPFPGEFVDIQITSEHGTKASGVSQLLSHLGVSSNETLGVGDSDNDLPMFSAVGTSAAMGNANWRVKEAATLVVPSVGAHGLATILYSLARDPSGKHLNAAWSKVNSYWT